MKFGFVAKVGSLPKLGPLPKVESAARDFRRLPKTSTADLPWAPQGRVHEEGPQSKAIKKPQNGTMEPFWL